MKNWVRNFLAGFDTPLKRTVGAVGLVLVVLLVALAVSWAVAPTWRHYLLRPIDLQVELPRPPVQSVGSGTSSENVAFESRSPRLAVLLAGQSFSESDRPESLAELAHRVMSAIEKHPDITEVKYKTQPGTLGDKTGLRIAGELKRKGVPGRVQGFVAVEGPRAWEVVVFFSDNAGARDADRVLGSLRFTAGTQD
ncbi:MAG: hypothetical protein GXP31_16505 [Kiritimatiellaeota bacterium]|nr:hypothetical protein [Kiritimatiellota bacterium]